MGKILDAERIDEERLEELTMLSEFHGSVVMDQLLASFFSDSETLLGQLEQALCVGDYPAGKQHCHQLKGMLANFGLKAGVNACEELERTLEGGSDSEKHANKIGAEFQFARSHLKTRFDLM